MDYVVFPKIKKKKVFWSPNLQYLCMWPYKEIGFLQR